MGYLKITGKDKPYRNPSDVINLIGYILEPSKNPHLVYGLNNLISCGQIPSVDVISSQFLCIQNTYKGTYSRRVHHIIYSLDNSLDDATLPVIYSIGLAFTWMYPYYQSILAIHENTKQLHLHMVINNVPLIDKAGTLTHHIDRLRMEFMADCIIDEYWSYYLAHSYYSKPNTIQMVKDAIAHHGAYIKRDIKKDPQI